MIVRMESLGNVLVKHISKLEKEKLEAVQEASARVQKNSMSMMGRMKIVWIRY